MGNKLKNVDTTRFCDFHKDVGHDTDNCYSLKMEIEAALRSGKRTNLVKNVRTGARNTEEPPKPIKDIKTNHVRGAYRRKCHMTQRNKRKLNPDSVATTSQPPDAGNTTHWKEAQVILPTVPGGANSTTPLIITTLFDHYRTYKMMCDSGSSFDIMYQQCFDQLDDEDKARHYAKKGLWPHQKSVTVYLPPHFFFPAQVWP